MLRTRYGVKYVCYGRLATDKNAEGFPSVPAAGLTGHLVRRQMLNQFSYYGAKTPESATSLQLSLCLILSQAEPQIRHETSTPELLED